MVQDIDGMTPLHLAAFYGQALVAVQLVCHVF
jgi:ankyrin repeat protein